MNLKIEIHEVDDKGLHHLKISTTVYGETHHTQMEFLEDEMLSDYDRMFYTLKYRLSEHIKAYEEDKKARKKLETEEDA